jgi:hypothetical protein
MFVGARTAAGRVTLEMTSLLESASTTVLLAGVIGVSVFAFAVVTHDALYLALYLARFWSLRADAALRAHLAHFLACLVTALAAMRTDLSVCAWLLETDDLAVVPAGVIPGAIIAELTESVATVVAETGSAASAMAAKSRFNLCPMAFLSLSLSSQTAGPAMSVHAMVARTCGLVCALANPANRRRESIEPSRVFLPEAARCQLHAESIGGLTRPRHRVPRCVSHHQRGKGLLQRIG